MGFFTEGGRNPPCLTLTFRESLIKFNGESDSGKTKAARNTFVNILALYKEPGNSQKEFDTGSVGVRDKWEHHC